MNKKECEYCRFSNFKNKCRLDGNLVSLNQTVQFGKYCSTFKSIKGTITRKRIITFAVIAVIIIVVFSIIRSCSKGSVDKFDTTLNNGYAPFNP